jgi:UDP-N-acetylglucosamine transferase subunit ALG13
VSRLVVVMLGTDHHPFDRLVDWTDEEARLRPGTRFVVQHGATRAPVVAEGSPFLPVGRIRALLVEAAAVVCHGGPGTIMDARSAGHVPICVPRDPALGEHVDGHQQRFARLVHDAGIVRRATDRQGLHDALDALLADHASPHGAVAPTSTATHEARLRLAVELDGLVRSRRRRAG